MARTLIHTSDWHLGAGLEGWPADLVARRSRERDQAVLAVVGAARARQAEFLVVAGDLIDGQRPVSVAVVEALRDLHAGGTQVVGLFVHSRGGHDSESRQTFASWFPGTILRPGESKIVDGVRFLGCDRVPHPDDVMAERPAERVVVLHSHERGMERLLKRLRGSASYVALGDCHQHGEVVEDLAYYSGSPSFRDLSSLDVGPRCALRVTLETRRVPRIEKLAIETPLSASVPADGKVRSVVAEAEILAALGVADYVRLRLALGDAASRSLVEHELEARGQARVVSWRTRSAAYRQYLLVGR